MADRPGTGGGVQSPQRHDGPEDGEQDLLHPAAVRHQRDRPLEGAIAVFVAAVQAYGPRRGVPSPRNSPCVDNQRGGSVEHWLLAGQEAASAASRRPALLAEAPRRPLDRQQVPASSGGLRVNETSAGEDEI